MLEFLQTQHALYVLAALGVLGIVSRLLMRSLYKRMIKETDRITLTKNKNLRSLKQKTETTYLTNQGIPKVKPFLERQMYDFRYLGVSFHGWNLFSNQMTLWCFLFGGAAAFASYWYHTDPYYIVLYGSVGILTGLFTILVDHMAGITEKRQQLFVALDNYLENNLIYRLEQERSGSLARGSEGRASREAQRDELIGQDAGEDYGTRENIRRLHPAADKEQPSPEIIRETDRKEGASMTKRQKARAERLKNQRREELKRAGGEHEAVDPAEGSAVASRLRAAVDGASGESLRAADVDYLKRSLEQIAASREREKTRHGGEDWLKDLSPEELQLIGEILKEYLT